ncbi:MAG: efflux RND transporter periplasmic adaptor subunit [Oleispira sp.]|nr:efflux RND transporter periplasmic adaptor subunit [Oleispira sp.]
MKILNIIKTLFVGIIFCSTLLSLSISPTFADSDEPGQEEEAEEGHIRLTPEQIEFAGIGLEEASSGNIREVLPLYGQVVTNEQNVHSVTARFEGVITKISKQIGDSVSQGEVLAMVESNDSLKSYAIKSSIAGVVIERNVNVGEQTSDKTLFKVADFSTVWVDLSAFPKDMVSIHLGQQTRIKCSASDVTGEGQVIYISPLGSDNQTTKVRVLLENPEHLLVPGHFITAEINLAETAVAVAIRSEAVQMVEEHNVVFVQEEEGFEPREVILGRTDGEFIEVLVGLKVGETYVTKNSFILKAEAGKGDIEDDD